MISRGNGGNQFLGRSSSSFSSRGGREEEFSGWKSKRRLNRRKIEGETSPGLSLAARKNHFRRLLTSLLDEKEASLRTRPPGKVAWKTASPLLSRPFLPSWAECWRADDIHPVWKVCGFRRDEGLGENAVTRPIPHGLPVDAAPSRRSMRRCSMTIILFSRGREKVWLESVFYFDEWFSSLFFFFFFFNDTSGWWNRASFQLCNFLVSPVSRIYIIWFNLKMSLIY